MATEFPIGANTNPAVKDIDKLIAALRKAGKEAGMTEKEIDDITDATKKAGTDGAKNIGNINKSMNNLVNDGIKKIGAAIVAAFAFDRIVQFGQQVIAITAEFQKFEAVLRNTLGSNSAAQIALSNIQKFAAQTPFSVKELTASFVKLANQGFIPTNEQMRKLGDLAASTGKQFDMLTEAIIDAQTGEFERLKEFGIRASKAGDQVTFTFKGVETQTKFTSEAIREYVLSLGDAEGVSGAMAAISETLGGQISNLGDSWDAFMVTVGDGNKGPLSGAVLLLSELIQKARLAIRTTKQVGEEVAGEIVAEQLEKFKEFAKGYGSLKEALEAYKGEVTKLSETINNEYGATVQKMMDNEITWKDRILGNVYAKDQQNKALEETRQRLGNEWQAYQQVIPAIEDYIKSIKKTPKAVDDITEAEKKLIEQRRKAREEFENTKGDKEDFTTFPAEASNLLNDMLLASFFVMEDKKTAKAKEEAEKRKKLDDEEAANELKKNEELADAKEYAFDIEMQAINALFDARSQAIENELSLNEAARARELENAGDNEEAKAKINKKFDEKQRALQNKQAQVQQQQALFNMTVNLGPSIAKTVSTLGFPAAIPFIAAIGVLFTTLMAKQKSVQVPKFATGVFDLEGPGTSTSDSIDARLSRGESVADADTTDKFGDILKPMIENEFFSYADIKRIVDKKLPSQVTTVIIPTGAGVDNPELLEELRATRKAVSNLKQVHVTIDKDGMKVMAQQGLQWTEYVNNRYST